MTALPASGAFTMVDPTWVEAVGPAAAILYARILWRCQRDGEWRATRKDIADETGLKPDVIRTATRVLRDREWVTTRRAGHFDAATVWTPVSAGQPDSGDCPTSSDRDCPTSDEGISPISSLETVETNTPLPPEGEPALFNDQPSVAPRTRPRRKPKTPYPDDFTPSQSHLDKCRELGVDLSVEGPKFQHYHQAKGSVFADWGAALHLWIRNAAGFAAERAAADNVTPIRPTNMFLPPTPRQSMPS